MTEVENWIDCYERAMRVADEAMSACEQLRLIILDQQQLLEAQQRTLTVAIETLERFRPRAAVPLLRLQ